MWLPSCCPTCKGVATSVRSSVNPRCPLRRVSTVVSLFIGAFLILGTGTWGTLALYFDGPENDTLRAALASTYAVAGLAALGAYCTRRFRWIAATSYTSMFIVLFAWWSLIEPSNDREWQPEVAVLPYATFDGDLVTVHNIRNFDYQSETDFTVAYEDRTYNLTKLDSVDLIAAYWMGADVDVQGINPASGGHLGYIPGGGVYYSALGDFLADATNRYAGVAFASPGAVRLEKQLIRWMAELIGYPSTAAGDLAIQSHDNHSRVGLQTRVIGGGRPRCFVLA